MSKRKKIIKLQQQIDELEARLASSATPAEVMPVEPRPKPAKTAVNVYFDSDFVSGMAKTQEVHTTQNTQGQIINTKERIFLQRADNGRRRRPRRRGGFGRFLKVMFRIIFILIVLALIAAILALLGAGVTWLLVNFGVWTPTTNAFVELMWKILEFVFGLLGRPVPML